MNGRCVFVSTSCLPEKGYIETLDAYASAGIEHVELGYCSDTTIDIELAIEEYPFSYIAHNFCFPISDEFILNLSSPDRATREKSIDYVCNAVSICDEYDIPYYTFHAGFRVDPDESLNFSTEAVPPYEKSFDLFVESLRQVIDRTNKYDVELAIENNVVTKSNVVSGDPLLLFCEPGEFTRLFEVINSNNVGILLDTGHLKVSSRTLNYNPEDFVNSIREHVRVLHVHTNNGIRDLHEPVGAENCESEISRVFSDSAVCLEAHYEDVTSLLDGLRYLRANEEFD